MHRFKEGEEGVRGGAVAPDLHNLTTPLSLKSSSSPSSLPPVNSLKELNSRIPAKSSRTGFQLSMSSLPNKIMTSLRAAAVQIP